jgi:hypothetical protein|nr:MAG TPA: zonular occludens toxin [Inoviridae sp.]
MDYQFLTGSQKPINIIKKIKYNIDFRKEHPDYFWPEGLLVFCGSQGSGKTLSAVQYIMKVCKLYPKAILCTNVEIKGLNPSTKVIEYNGINCLKNLENGQFGVIYFIDEIHLEFNSLESKNIDIDIMIEISQQRKQRKHIVGTSQVYGRMAKPLREQIKNAVLCQNYFGCIQRNILIDGDKTHEEDGKLVVDKSKTFFWIHNPELYSCYDTYAKMRRYRNEWQGRKRIETR